MAKTKIKAKKTITVAAEIAQRNKRFKAATPAQKRVLIAKDVLEQIKRRRFVPEVGSWATFFTNVTEHWQDDWLYLHIEGDLSFKIKHESMQQLFLKERPTCECCALGALFVSSALYTPTATLAKIERDLAGDGLVRIERGAKTSTNLGKYFSKQQLKLIEAAFEGNIGAFRLSDEKLVDKTELWYETYPEPKKRMVAIMKNIIANNGT